MPRPRRPDRERIAGALPEVWQWWFTDQITMDEVLKLDSHEHPQAFDVYLADDEPALWQQHCDALLGYWIDLHPGTRPRAWWVYSAPQVDLYPDLYPQAPERPMWAIPRLRLGGTGEAILQPDHAFGIPSENWVRVDPDDRPVYESQASYLRRNRLLLPGEEERLTAKDFEPEVIPVVSNRIFDVSRS